MIIELASVTERPKVIERAFTEGEIDLDLEDAKAVGRTDLHGVAQRIEGKAHISGRLTANVEFACVRCLQTTLFKIDAEFDDVFIEPDAEGETDVSLEAEELDESYALDGRIDIAEAVREQIILALPDRPLCGEDCKGLCPKCGTNLNLIKCNCITSDTDPRWAALKQIR